MRDCECNQPRANRWVVHPRTRHRTHGPRPENLGAESIRTVARRQEFVRGGWKRIRECQLPKSHLDHPGFMLAFLRLPGGRIPERESLTRRSCPRTIALI